MKRVLLAIALLCLVIFQVPQPALAVEIQTGAQVFEAQCAGCHINGGNIVRRNKTLKLKALQRNEVDTVEAITAIVTNGKNNMSAYGDRLTAEQIEAVANYVLDRAEQNWN